GELLLSRRRSHRAGDGMGHALSTRAGVGVLPRPAPRRRGTEARRGGVRMSECVIKLSDVGEGVAEAEIVELMVKVGEPVREGDVVAAVMTDKATVEIPSPADGRVSWIGWGVVQKAAVGSELMKIEVGDGTDTTRELAARTKGAAAADRDQEEPQRPPQFRSAQEPSQLAPVESERPHSLDPAAS